MSTTNSIKLLTGNSHGGLAKLVADRYAKITKTNLSTGRMAASMLAYADQHVRRLGIDLAKIMVLQYSNNESSISIGESVRDEDGRSDSSLTPSSSPLFVLEG